ncbi:uncharacterized protein [Antedon mediterranea]|uniref:uncharacterized protein n=1 Tax=Antedon mediterranea TaxID=105859 RepID=UPI003AF7F07E
MDLHGRLVNLCAKNGLEIAREKTAEEICHFIVSNNAVNIKDQDGDTALMCAALAGNTTICQLVLDGGADVNMQNNSGNTALHWGARYGHVDVCQTLVDMAAAVDQQNNVSHKLIFVIAFMIRILNVVLIHFRLKCLFLKQNCTKCIPKECNYFITV